MQFLVFCLVVATSYAMPVDFSNYTLTIDKVNRIIEKINANSSKFLSCITHGSNIINEIKIYNVLLHSEYFPSYVLNAIVNSSDAERSQFVDFMNKFYSGQIPKAENRLDMISKLEMNAPLIAQKFKSVMDIVQSKLSNLTEQGRQFVQKLENTSYNVSDPNRMTWFTNIVRSIPELLTEIKGLTPETWNSLKQEFPEYVNAWNEHPLIKAMRVILESLPKSNSDKMIEETIDKLLAVIKECNSNKGN
uniref:Fatty-acid and retinol-binding protein 1 n=2 Tax=Heterorhabditis bacteriophora TaxID=37862 RepID=A0A1I7X244_HETBA